MYRRIRSEALGGRDAEEAKEAEEEVDNNGGGFLL
jgi:hypothetical protein